MLIDKEIFLLAIYLSSFIGFVFVILRSNRLPNKIESMEKELIEFKQEMRKELSDTKRTLDELKERILLVNDVKPQIELPMVGLSRSDAAKKAWETRRAKQVEYRN